MACETLENMKISAEIKTVSELRILAVFLKAKIRAIPAGAFNLHAETTKRKRPFPNLCHFRIDRPGGVEAYAVAVRCGRDEGIHCTIKPHDGDLREKPDKEEEVGCGSRLVAGNFGGRGAHQMADTKHKEDKTK